MPDGAIDAHCHVIVPRLGLSPGAKYAPPECSWEEQYEVLIRRCGFSGIVPVQATAHGVNNEPVVDACVRSGGRAMGVGAVNEDVTDAELERLNAAGVRGVRFAFLPHIMSETTPLPVIERIAARVAELGWHIDLYFQPENFDIMKPMIEALPAKVIIDHMGRPDVVKGVDHPEFQRFVKLVADNDKIFVKLTCPDRLTKSARPEDWPAALPFAHALLALAPDRMVTGTDRPHPNMDKAIATGRGPENNKMPDDGAIVNHWIWPLAHKDPAILKQILVDNPRRLYDFGPGADKHPG